MTEAGRVLCQFFHSIVLSFVSSLFRDGHCPRHLMLCCGTHCDLRCLQILLWVGVHSAMALIDKSKRKQYLHETICDIVQASENSPSAYRT